MTDRVSLVRALLLANWKLLRRDRVALLLTFALPPAFFAVFATIFGGGGGGESGAFEPLRVITVDLDHSKTSAALIERLLEAEAVVPAVLDPVADAELTPERAAAYVREGDADAAVVVAQGFERDFVNFWETPPRVQLYFDASNPISRFALEGLIQAATFQAAPTVLMGAGFGALDRFGAGMTDAQRNAVAELERLIEQQTETETDGGEGDAAAAVGMQALVRVESRAATELSGSASAPSIVDYYAAACGVMFLLFSMAGAASALLEEAERGTLERLLMTGTGVAPVLLGHFVFFSLVGFAQLWTMFAFGGLCFGMHVANLQVVVGISIVGLATSAAASAFALCLATACRTRAQLSGLSTIVILVMSAIGGSMVPRFIMPAFMKSLGHFTFNGWALDGFLAVLWERDPEGSMLDLVRSIALPTLVLVGVTLALLFIARRLARRWETI